MSTHTAHHSYALREGTAADISVLARHPRLMFEDIAGAEQKPSDPVRLAAVETAYREKLHREITTGTCTAWVVEQGGLIVASGGMRRLPNVPVPKDPQCHGRAPAQRVYGTRTPAQGMCGHDCQGRTSSLSVGKDS